MKNVLFISYFFQESDGVGALRSRSLFKFLKQKDCNIFLIEKDKSKIRFLYKIFSNLRKNRYDSVYITCGPFFHLFFVSLLCWIYKHKLIVDIRDSWFLNIQNGYGTSLKNNRRSMKYFIAYVIEKYAYKISDVFIVCTYGMKEKYSSLFKSRDKIVIIENGYGFSPISQKVTSFGDEIKFICVGKFSEYNEEKAIDILLRINKIKLHKKVKITFIGSDREKNVKLVSQMGLLNETIFINKLPYEEMKNKIIESDIGLLVIRDESIDYGTKIFDYIGLSKPVLFNKKSESIFVDRFSDYLVSDDEIINDKINFSFIDNYLESRNYQFERFLNVLY